MATILTTSGLLVEFDPMKVGMVYQVSFNKCRIEGSPFGVMFVPGTVKEIVKKYKLDHTMLIGSLK